MSITYLDRPIKSNPAYVKNQLIADDRYRTFQERGPLGAVLHSIGTPQPSASVIGEYFDSPSVEASVHMVLQADGLCYRLAPDHYRMWHVGGSANNTHMGIEMTEPRGISYDPSRGYQVTIHNRTEALIHVKQTYERAVELFADLAQTYGWDPLQPGVILSHRECYEQGLGSNHGDPEHLWQALNTGYTMDTFRKAVAREIERRTALSRPTDPSTDQPSIPVEKQEVKEMRYTTLGQLKQDPGAREYLPTVEKLIAMGILLGKGGSGEDRILDLSEDAIRILVLLDRNGTFSQ